MKRIRVTKLEDITKLEFCQMFRKEICFLIHKYRNQTWSNPKDIQQFVNDVARGKLNYSQSTAVYDIWHGIKKHYSTLIILK